MPGKTTVAAHVDHVHYGLTLLNRWAAGEANPFADADWNASWQRTTVSPEQWRTLRDNLRRQAETWRGAVAARAGWDDISAAGALSSAGITWARFGRSWRPRACTPGNPPVNLWGLGEHAV
jgi:hypothetical protein